GLRYALAKIAFGNEQAAAVFRDEWVATLKFAADELDLHARPAAGKDERDLPPLQLVERFLRTALRRARVRRKQVQRFGEHDERQREHGGAILSASWREEKKRWAGLYSSSGMAGTAGTAGAARVLLRRRRPSMMAGRRERNTTTAITICRCSFTFGTERPRKNPPRTMLNTQTIPPTTSNVR